MISEYLSKLRNFISSLASASSPPATTSVPGEAAEYSRPIPIFETSFNLHGILESAHLADTERRNIALYYPYRERAEVAMTVASMFSGGDYFEFGSEGMGTFRNFLSAFHIFDHHKTLPDTRFYAFDIFGDPAGTPESESGYFKNWSDPVNDRYDQAKRMLEQHRLLKDNCHLVRGDFAKTLSPEFSENYLAENRSIGFAFLDCNQTRSYILCFDFLPRLLKKNAFIYMDEYYCNSEVPELFDAFQRNMFDKYKVRARFIRAAAGFGALYQLQPSKAATY